MNSELIVVQYEDLAFNYAPFPHPKLLFGPALFLLTV